MLKPQLAEIFTKPRLTKRVGLAVGGAVLAAATAITGVAGTASASTASAADRVPPAHSQVKALTYGLDVSGYQALYNWNSSSAQFGIVKATEGTTFTDSSFDRHWHELGAKGIVRGAYDFGHPRNNPIAEAKHFLAVVNSQPAKPGDLLVLDLESSDGKSVAEVNAWAKAWLGYVKQATGTTPMFYSGWNFANTYGAGLQAYPLWVAHYGIAKGSVTPPADWKSWTIHQYTDSPIDQNVSSLTPAQLRSLGRPASAKT